MIDPSIWEDPGFNKLSSNARLLFIGMISNADDEGYIRADAGSLRRLIFGFDDVVSKYDVQSYIDELQSMASIHFYDDDGEWYAHFTNWTKFQKLQRDRIQSSLYPMCSKCVADDKQVPTQVSIGKSRLEQNSVGKESAERKTNYPSQSSGSVADAQEKPKSVPEIARMREEIRKKRTPTLGVLLILFALLLLAKPTYAAKPQKIVVRYTITTPTLGHKLKPTAHTVAGGIGRGTSTSIPASPTSSASQQTVPPSASHGLSGREEVLAGAEPYTDRIVEAAKDHGVPVQLFYRVLRKESMSFNASVIACNLDSPVGARGIAQFMPSTAAGIGIDPCNPDEAIPASARYLSAKKQEHGSWSLALAAYNAGSGNVRKYGGIPPFAETQNYVASIMEGLNL